MSKWTVSCLAALAIASASAGAAQASGISGKWRIVAVSDVAGLDASRTELALDETGAATMTVGCNRMRSRATIANGKITFGPVAATRMACPPPLAEIEGRFVEALNSVSTFKVDGGRLRFLDDGGTVMVQLQRPQ